MQTSFFYMIRLFCIHFTKYNGLAILGMLRIFCLALEELLHKFAHDYWFYRFEL